MNAVFAVRRGIAAGLCWAAATSVLAASPPTATAPVAPVRDVPTTLHGVTVHDPYRYMENLKDPEVKAWMLAQGEVTRGALDRIAVRETLLKRIEEVSSASGDAVYGVVRMPGDKVYYMKRPKGERQYKLVMRQGLAGPEQVLVDPEVDAKRTGVPHAINYFVPSWDGKHVAYGMSAGGSEDASLYILNVQNGKPVGQPIPRVHEAAVSWLPDSQSLTYNQLREPAPGAPESEFYLDSKVMWLKLGDSADRAVAVFGPTVTKGLGLARLDVGKIIISPDSPYMVARTTDTTLSEGFLFVAKVADLGKPGLKWTRISAFADGITDAQLKGNDLYLMTHQGAPRNKVMKLDLAKPQLKLAREVAVAPKDGVLEEFILNKDAVVASVRQGTSIGVRIYAAGDKQGKAVAMPFVGAAYTHPDPAHAHSDVLYGLSGWTQLPRIFLFDGKESKDAGLRSNVPLPPLPEIEITEVKAPSYDGTLVPMTILHKKGLKLDGSNPTLLNGYAGYGFSETAGFSPSAMVWMEQGGVVAYANVRGSGVYGHDWYHGGFKATKHNTWRDGVASAQYLIKQGYASPKTLGVMGTSAGGIFVGRTTTSAPQLFAAAIFNVGILDAVRAEESANGITNISEFGSAKNAKDFPALLEMSTYHQIKDGTAYPAVLLVHGMNDPRVDPWHSAKTTARLQAASSSGKPVLLRLDLQAGHGVGSTATQRYALSADIYSFLLWQMGKAQQNAAP